MDEDNLNDLGQQDGFDILLYSVLHFCLIFSILFLNIPNVF